MTPKEIYHDNAYRALCLFVLFVLCVSAFTSDCGNVGRSTSLRNRVQKKIESIADSFDVILN